MNYEDFLKSKQYTYNSTGFEVSESDLNSNMFDFQKAIVKWALKKGKSALFLDTGLGKTICQLEFANQVCKHTNGNALILAPLAVSKQTYQEGLKFGINVNICRTQADVKSGINITNYEMLNHFNPKDFNCIILDESSILKSFQGKFCQEIIELFRFTEYKLACTATPSPNDYQELGTHSEFLGVMTRTEMLATFFINDAKENHWRMKKHAESKFWEWLATWAMVVKNPKDIGFNHSGYDLPKLNINHIIVDSPVQKGSLLPKVAETLSDRRLARKSSINNKLSKVSEILSTLDNCLIWVDYNDESDLISKKFNIVEVKGSDTNEHKENAMLDFANGDIKYLVSKPSICGFGMNFQKCCNMIFFGLSDSYEKFYQAIRRCYRFGQTKEVNVYVIISQSELSVLNNIKRKQENHLRMQSNMIDKTSEILKNEICSTMRITEDYIALENVKIPDWLITERC